MRSIVSEKISRWLLPTVLILFVLEIITLPFVMGVTYSGRSEDPDHILTYKGKGVLVWDKDTGIDKNGVARLDFFDAYYRNVFSLDLNNVVAPGTEGYNIVRLVNNAPGPVKYTAVLYRIRTTSLLPVETDFINTDLAETDRYPLPEGVSEDNVIRAVSGYVDSGRIADLDVAWLWRFYEDPIRDAIDTMLGNRQYADNVTVGLYIVVEDNIVYDEPVDPVEPDDPDEPDDPITPQPPETSDTRTGIYIGLMVISFAVLVLLIIDRIMAKKCERLK